MENLARDILPASFFTGTNYLSPGRVVDYLSFHLTVKLFEDIYR